MRPAFESPAALLLQADRVFLAKQPASSVDFATSFGAHVLSYFARFDYPGIVSVFDANTGELIARSEPGQPTKLATVRRPRASR